MPTNAGTMYSGAQPNPQWVNADGKPYYVLDAKQTARPHAVLPSEGNRQDYIRKVGWRGRRRGLGPLGWIVLMPVNAGWVVSLADDSVESNLASPPTVMNPPVGTK
jgi:hypothetical protein